MVIYVTFWHEVNLSSIIFDGACEENSDSNHKIQPITII